MRQWITVAAATSAALLFVGTASSAQTQPSSTPPRNGSASEIAGVQSSVSDCPRVFVAATWTISERGTAEIALSYADVECGAPIGIIGSGIIANADFTVTWTGA